MTFFFGRRGRFKRNPTGPPQLFVPRPHLIFDQQLPQNDNENLDHFFGGVVPVGYVFWNQKRVLGLLGALLGHPARAWTRLGAL